MGPAASGCTTYHSRWADTRRMNDFHIALLWLHSLEALVGHPSILMLSDVELDDLFVRYRSPYKA
jgi:hypothetical protein